MLTSLTSLHLNVSCVNIGSMEKKTAYHHGDLRAALLKAAAEEIELNGYETLSLRELATSLDVSRAAPYRHFPDKRALLATLASEGFEQLIAIYRTAAASSKSAEAKLKDAGLGYLELATKRPQLFRLMFASDLFGGSEPPDPKLSAAALESYQLFEGMVAGALGHPDIRTVKATTIAAMSATYGFALLCMGDRLRPFMVGDLTRGQLIDAVLSLRPSRPPET
jgi:AcrR family transcriptional regulator